MPYIAIRRTDIPNGVLQVLDLAPNTSNGSQTIEPPGQTKYLRNVQNDPVVTVGAGPITTVGSVNGLAAYLIDRVENQAAGQALTATQANTAASALVARLNGGLTLQAANVAAALVAAGAGPGTSLTAGNSLGTLAEFLQIIGGGGYLLPGGTEVEDGANAFVATVKGEFTTPYKYTYLTGYFLISNGEGMLFKMKQPNFFYDGVASPAIVVYADDGTIL